MIRYNKNRGYTLIEILVVFGLIGILATFMIAFGPQMLKRGRDASRKSDLRQIQAGIEMYRADQGYYPNPAVSNHLPVTCGSNLNNSDNTITYIKPVPCNRGITWNGGEYYYTSNGSTYTLTACLENENEVVGGDILNNNFGITLPACASSRWYVLYNP